MFKLLSDTVKSFSLQVTPHTVQRSCIRKCEQCKFWYNINSCSPTLVRCSRHLNSTRIEQNGLCTRTITNSRRKNISK